MKYLQPGITSSPVRLTPVGNTELKTSRSTANGSLIIMGRSSHTTGSMTSTRISLTIIKTAAASLCHRCRSTSIQSKDSSRLPVRPCTNFGTRMIFRSPKNFGIALWMEQSPPCNISQQNRHTLNGASIRIRRVPPTNLRSPRLGTVR